MLRLPLGILTGMGFIGAGAIVRAATGWCRVSPRPRTLWFVTVMGLCFGAGQFRTGRRRICIRPCHLMAAQAARTPPAEAQGGAAHPLPAARRPDEEAVKAILTGAGAKIRRGFVRYEPGLERREYRFNPLVQRPTRKRAGLLSAPCAIFPAWNSLTGEM